MSKRRMPVNILEGGQTRGGEQTILDNLVRSDENGPDSWPTPTVPSSREVREKVDARRLERARSDVRLWALGSALLGLVQVGWLAFLLVVALQMKMAGALAQRYQIFFSRDLVKRFGVCLLGGILALVGSSVLEYVLFSGQAFNILWLGLSTFLSSMLIGKIFIKHFEAGETLFELDPEPMKEFFRRKYGDG